jgi:hypothetical protein
MERIQAQGEPSGSTGGPSGSQEPTNAPVSVPDFDYVERGQNPADTHHRDVKLKERIAVE